MDVVVGCLVVWAAGKAQRVGRRINGLTDQALDAAVDRVWAVVAPKLGADPVVQELVAESRDTGDAPLALRIRAGQVLQKAAREDPQFAADLQAAVPAEEGQAQPATVNSGVMTGNISAGGNVNVSNKVITYAKHNPGIAFFIVVVLGAGLWLLGKALSGGADTSTDSTTIVGSWNASDGTGLKVFGSNGQCDGFYYNGTTPLDIGGPMTCVLSSKPDTQNRYTLTVTQRPNRDTYKVEFSTADHATVYSDTGQKLYEIDRS
ncbi:hypothetical protein R8Z50_19040 [Longispora sp. K20-0274]|uniref:hypothetical protein n=1 Tax=Longispora sp. K20-0274 TaxID=3088255 RepID=UPI00399B952D